MGIGQKVCALVGSVILQALQHSKHTIELVIQKTQRVISVNDLGQQKSLHSLAQPWLVMMEKVCKVIQIIFTDSRNNIIVDVLHRWRRRIKTEMRPACRMVISTSCTANFAVLIDSSVFRKCSSDIRRTALQRESFCFICLLF